MKHVRSLALVLATLVAPLFAQETPDEDEVSFDYFRDALSPFGEWIQVADYGLCWRPTGVAADWAPYTDGYWAYTDAGWTWVSYEDWGGITYHYGRWVNVVDEGWVWVPDYQWGPAWVSWRSDEDHIGWAPLPPEARWDEGSGFGVWVDTSYDIGPESYRFCHTRDFCAPVLAPLLLPCERNVTFIAQTVNITNICFNRRESLVFCGGPDFGRISLRLPRPIPTLKLVCEHRGDRDSHRHAPQVVRGNVLAVYAPRVKRPGDVRGLNIAPQRTIGADKVNRGWSKIPDVAQRQEIKQRLEKQSEGLTPVTAPARPVRPADVSVVPKIATPNVPTPGIVRRGGSGRNVDRPQTTPAPVQQPPQPVVVNPVPVPPQPVVRNPEPVRVQPSAHPPVVSERVRPQPVQPEKVARPVQPPTRAFNNPPTLARPVRPPQAAVQTEPAQTPDTAQVEAARRASEARRQQIVQQRQQAQQAEAAQQQRQVEVQRANALRNQQAQQAQAVERARESRNQQVQQAQAAQRANEIRNQQAQQAQAQAQAVARQQAIERSREIRQQQAVQAEGSRRPPIVAPQPRPVQPAQPSQPAAKDGDDGKKKHRGAQ